MTSDIETIKQLRDETGLSIGEIKKALDQADGEEAKAREILAELGKTMAAKKSSREAKEGIVSSYIHTTAKVGSMVEILCETDFVARNEAFTVLARDVAMQIAAMKPTNEEELLTQPFIKDPSLTIKDLLNQSVAKLGENIKLGRFVLFEI